MRKEKIYIKKIIFFLLLTLLSIIPYSAYAILSMELTRGVAGAIPIAVVPFTFQGEMTPTHDVSSIITHDLQNSGRFKVYGRSALSVFPNHAKDIAVDYFRRLGTDNVVVGRVQGVGSDRYEVSFQLVNVFQGNAANQTPSLTKKFTVSGNELRALAHHMSDLIYQQITGQRGVFSTKLAYVLVQRGPGPTRYILEVADQDGYNPRPLLTSTDPIMSASWSPNGRQIAYVSFEKNHASIYIEDVVSGARRLISEFPGINGAPAWSRDGKKLALVLSKSGSPNIYIMDVATRQLTQLTHDFYINTEPAWSPNGKSLLFTSNRSGGPQIYELTIATRAVTRVTYDGDYNARASYLADGSGIALIHRASGVYSIALLNLNTNTMRVLTSLGTDSDSPSVAPNSSMILYDTIKGGRSVLAMVSVDGRIQLHLPARLGEAKDPAWSPFLS